MGHDGQETSLYVSTVFTFLLVLSSERYVRADKRSPNECVVGDACAMRTYNPISTLWPEDPSVPSVLCSVGPKNSIHVETRVTTGYCQTCANPSRIIFIRIY